SLQINTVWLVARLRRQQQALLDNPPALAPRDPERLRKSREHGMPPLAYDLLVREGAWLPSLPGSCFPLFFIILLS
ncbi:hypothetical protein, partial [Klebsiella pneumoniae]|uniref:formate dehydrogenase accessory protein FdhE domain-containing protein n=1 Tax=Klebsiella pneumoniae TaxID=573 RepID=UPI00396973CF